MNIIWNSWKNSLEVFHKDQFFRFFRAALKSFFRGAYLLCKKFWWLIILNLALLLAMKRILNNYPLADLQSLEIGKGQILLFFVSSLSFIFNLITSAVIILSILKSCIPHSIDFKNGILKYFQFILYLGLLSFFIWDFITWILTSRAISLHWSLNYCFVFINFFSLFYWFDSSFTLKDFFRSIELSINFIFYNLPFILIIISLYFFSDVFVNHLLSLKPFTSAPNVALLKDYLNSAGIKEYFFLQVFKDAFHFFLLIISYLFFINKKDELRYKSFFPSSTEEEIE